jgi:Glycoside hydrolase family 2 C-terminal domain 5/Glycosyl hydrolases family 2, TIM barrel domain/Glycosyl hydrolases family 2, sugar binding domain/Glycosyl hydrolases family 2/Domain of unknown function (DUF4982)
MNLSSRWNAAVITAAIFLLAAGRALAQRERTSFDDGWRFLKGDSAGAERETFKDEQWRLLDLPHDFSIEDLQADPAQALNKTSSPFDSRAPGGAANAFTRGGVGWYRKTFDVPTTWGDKKIVITFDGVYHDATIWLNGKKLLTHRYGYTSFSIELNEFLHFGGTNVLAVKVDTSGNHTRWYSGSGIYRHVWLDLAEPFRVTTWGIAITSPVVRDDDATVSVRTKLRNDYQKKVDCTLGLSIRDASGTMIATASSQQIGVAPQTTEETEQTIVVPRPRMWSPEQPSLYSLVTDVKVGGIVTDRVETTFGIRSIAFDAQSGFQLNGRIVKLRGGCVHHDNGPLGSAAFDRAEERRVELLKAAGFNAIRTSHNPPSPAFLDACDRLGMLVIDEAFDCWTQSKNPEDYGRFFEANWQADLRSMVERDRNHPSIILWSIGNEIPEQGSRDGNLRARQLADMVRSIDSSRPVTIACSDRVPNTILMGGFVSVLLLAQFVGVMQAGILQRGLRSTPWIAMTLVMSIVAVWLYFRTSSPWKAGVALFVYGGGLLALRFLIIRREAWRDRSAQRPDGRQDNPDEPTNALPFSSPTPSHEESRSSRTTGWRTAWDCIALYAFLGLGLLIGLLARSSGLFNDSRPATLAAVDVPGLNYQFRDYDSQHRQAPLRAIVGTESYPKEAFLCWGTVEEKSFVAGDFVWAAFDYLGEAGIGRVFYPGQSSASFGEFPWTVAGCGDLDLCGARKPQSYYRGMLWGIGPRVAAFVDSVADGEPEYRITDWGWPDERASWTWPGKENKILTVRVYSRTPKVKLIVNGHDEGDRETGRARRFTATYKIPYEPGELVAVGLDAHGTEIERWTLTTAGLPARLRLTADRPMIRADGQDLSYVTAEVLDEKNVLCPNFTTEIQFSVDGPGKILAVGNGNPASTESFQQPRRSSFQGRCLVILKSERQPGTLILKARMENLPVAETLIDLRKPN